MSPSQDSSNQPKRAVVGRSLRCRSCGYDLRGLRLEFRCPECGLPVKTTVDETIDVPPHDPPPVRNPRQLGNSLVWLTVCMFACVLLVSMPPVAGALREVDGWADGPLLTWLPAELLLGAAAIALLGLRAAWVLIIHDRRGTDGTLLHRHGRIIGAGLLIIALAAAGAWAFERVAIDLMRTEAQAMAEQLWLRIGFAFGGWLLLLGLGRVLNEVGFRSRMYREARSGKQSTTVMAVALVFIALGTVGQLAASMWAAPALQWSSEVLVLACALMLWIGCAYLVMNAWWVRTALARPAPRLRDIVRIEPDTTAMRPPTRRGPGHPQPGERK